VGPKEEFDEKNGGKKSHGTAPLNFVNAKKTTFIRQALQPVQYFIKNMQYRRCLHPYYRGDTILQK